ncbi:ACT domain-containing protein [Acidisoma silvae]|uniref:ACT domain-containing protein n=1 Tax=Acidisoma silvae TaxID=2802396 RepID=A0A963YYD8_9PROT|nr:ACT domain-containing protein [Acidisoma silvae]MCB8878525.1 ACT domain-containing protein [Acidisoma silvae]
MSLKLRIVSGQFAVAQLAPDSDMPSWLPKSGFVAAVRSDDELTIVCDAAAVPTSVRSERNWLCLRTVGPFAFQATGIVQSLISPLSSNGIGFFVICTFDGEHLLIQEADWEQAQDHLKQAGHVFLSGA